MPLRLFKTISGQRARWSNILDFRLVGGDALASNASR